MREKALKWLYDWLRKKRVALRWAEDKTNVQKEEIENIFNQLSISTDVRPADLSLQDWEALAQVVAK